MTGQTWAPQQHSKDDGENWKHGISSSPGKNTRTGFLHKLWTLKTLARSNSIWNEWVIFKNVLCVYIYTYVCMW